jgi:hypothetical protein
MALPPPPPAAAAANSTFKFTSNHTKHTYMLSTIPRNFDGAQAFCNSQGAHLASFKTPQEQAEVEKYFWDFGTLLPGYHTFYYMGLNVTGNSSWPHFTYVDRAPPPNASDPNSYVNWGNYQADVFSNETVPEPNNGFPPEHCAGANYTESAGQPGPWKWADTNCNGAWPFVCKALREWRLGVPAMS